MLHESTVGERTAHTLMAECRKLREERDALLSGVKEAWVQLYTLDIRLDHRLDLWTRDERRVIAKLDALRQVKVSS